jgi:UDP-N-acetylmuramoylalanine--D-glutamate ligase
MLAARARPAAPEPPYLVAGLGRAGLAAASALLARGDPSTVVAWDGSPAPRDGRAVEHLRRLGVRTALGDDGTALLDSDPRPRTVVASPGLPDDLPLLQAARACGLAVLDESELGWRLDTRPWVGITGTNGKSTTVRLVAAVLRANGAAPVLGGNTYGAPPLCALDAHGDVVVAEISSFQLERSEHLIAEAALLTQVGCDHLDRHGTRARYAALKERLFLRGDAHADVAAVSVDDAYGRAIAERLRATDAHVVTFGLADGVDVRGRALDWDLDGGAVEVRVEGSTSILRTRLPGPHNAANVAGAMALARALGVDTTRAGEAIAATPPPPGRLAHLDVRSAGDVVFDFAKNASGVKAALETVRRVTARRGTRVTAVVSAMPVADAGGLFAMGAAAGSGADTVILTVDRWSASTPPDPHPELVRGTQSTGREVEIVGDRRAALARALEVTGTGDVLVVLGRTPTPMPNVGTDGSIAPFDDAVELRNLAAG